MEKRLLSACFGVWKSGSFNNLVKNKATVDAHGYVIYSPHCICTSVNRYSVGVVHIGVGFDVARFDKMGDARASTRGTSNSTDSRAFSF